MTPGTDPEISCETCVAACCRAPVNMIMTAAEHRRYGREMDLRVVLKPAPVRRRVTQESSGAGAGAPLEIPAGHGLFELTSGCAHLTDAHRCSIYSTRPSCCRDFAVGSRACLELRRAAGLDSHLPPLEDGAASAGVAERLLSEFFPAATRAEAAPPRTGAARPAPLGLADVRRLVASENRWISERLASADAALWSRRTRCSEWSFGVLAAHVVSVEQFALAALVALEQGRAAHAPAEFAGDRGATREEFGRAAGALEAVLHRLPPALADADVTVDDTTTGVTDLLQVLAMEVAVHAADLAQAASQERRLDPDALRAVAHALPDLLDPGVPPRPPAAYVLRSIAFELPFTWRGGVWRAEAGPDPCVIEGDAEAVLLYALGRISFDQARLTVSHADRARAFKRHLVGP